jgi:hypothetical protein
MVKHFLILILFVSAGVACNAQKSDPAYRKVDSFIRDYMQLSRLGPGYSREMSQEITDQFKALFERDALLCWDLYRYAADSLFPPMAVNEYVELAKRRYLGLQPLLDYPGIRIKVQPGGKHAVVYVKKINKLVDREDEITRSNQVNLRVNVNLEKDQPLIRNISEDKRKSFVRSVSVAANYLAWSTAVSTLVYRPVVLIGANEQYRQVKIQAEVSFQAGGMLEIRIDREKPGGLTFSTGFLYSQLPMSSSMADYEKSYPDTLDLAPGNPVACTTFERSPDVWENILVKKIEIPLLLKSYLNDWIYLKSGTCLGFVTGTADVSYVLSRTGGGLVTDLTSHESYYLDQDHEFDQKNHGYYRNKNYSFSKEKFLNKVILSMHLAVGFEKQVKSFGFELEPNISLGMNPLSNRTPANGYPLDDVKNFNPVFKSTKMPAFEVAFGIRFMVSYLFKK